MIEGPGFTMMSNKEWQLRMLKEWGKEEDQLAKTKLKSNLLLLTPLVAWWIASTVHITCNKDRYFDGWKIKRLW